MNRQLSIQAVSRLTGLSRHTLRYYEREGLMLDPIVRASSGHRRYSTDDLGWLEMVTCLRATGMPIRHIRRFAELCRQGEDTVPQRIELLESHRAELLRHMRELEGYLEMIARKIDYYEGEQRRASVAAVPDSVAV